MMPSASACCALLGREHLVKARSGRIINVESMAGMLGRDRRVYEGTEMGGVAVDYSAAKAGVLNRNDICLPEK